MMMMMSIADRVVITDTHTWRTRRRALKMVITTTVQIRYNTCQKTIINTRVGANATVVEFMALWAYFYTAVTELQTVVVTLSISTKRHIQAIIGLQLYNLSLIYKTDFR